MPHKQQKRLQNSKRHSHSHSITRKNIHHANTTTIRDVIHQNKLVLKPELQRKSRIDKVLSKHEPRNNRMARGQRLQRHNPRRNRFRTHKQTACFQAVKKAVEKGAIVAMTSQCIWGRVNMNVYDTGRDLQALGVIPLEDMLAETATSQTHVDISDKQKTRKRQKPS
jgi:hypothetical protein